MDKKYPKITKTFFMSRKEVSKNHFKEKSPKLIKKGVKKILLKSF